MKLDFHPAVFINIDFFVLRPDDGGGLQAVDVRLGDRLTRSNRDGRRDNGKAVTVGKVSPDSRLLAKYMRLLAAVMDVYENILFVQQE